MKKSGLWIGDGVLKGERVWFGGLKLDQEWEFDYRDGKRFVEWLKDRLNLVGLLRWLS